MVLQTALTEPKGFNNRRGRLQPARAMFPRCVAIVAAVAASVLSVLPQAGAVVVTDNFSDLNDTVNPAWVHLDGAVASTGQTWDASTGRYRLRDPVTETGGSQIEEFGGLLLGFGFVGSYVPTTFTDVKVTADIVEFFPPGFQSSYIGFAVAARLNGDNGAPNSERGAALRGYSYQYEPTSDSGRGEMVLTIIHGEFFKDVGSFKVALDSAVDYRVSLEVVGNTLHGKVIELDALGAEVAVVADQFKDLDASPPDPDNYDGPENPVRPFEPYTSGFSGVYGVGWVPLAHDADFTIDNFRTESVGTPQPGDFDGDGDVDAADLAEWEGDYKDNADSDADLDGDTDGDDFLVWQRNVGAPGATPALAAVPEPGTLWLSGVATAIAAATLRSRKAA